LLKVNKNYSEIESENGLDRSEYTQMSSEDDSLYTEMSNEVLTLGTEMSNEIELHSILEMTNSSDGNRYVVSKRIICTQL
jgi:hypothetical protein